MNQNSFNKLDLKKIIIGLFFLVLPMACDGGSDGNDGGGVSNEPFVSACDGFIATITGTEGETIQLTAEVETTESVVTEAMQQ